MQFSLCAEFLRCSDVKQLVRTCKDVDDIQVLSMKTTMAAVQKEQLHDIRDVQAEKSARHRRLVFASVIDWNGHYLAHDRIKKILGH